MALSAVKLVALKHIVESVDTLFLICVIIAIIKPDFWPQHWVIFLRGLIGCPLFLFGLTTSLVFHSTKGSCAMLWSFSWVCLFPLSATSMWKIVFGVMHGYSGSVWSKNRPTNLYFTTNPWTPSDFSAKNLSAEPNLHKYYTKCELFPKLRLAKFGCIAHIHSMTVVKWSSMRGS